MSRSSIGRWSVAGLLTAGMTIAVGTEAADRPPLANRGTATATVQLTAAPEPLPAFTARTLDGQTVRSADWRGQVTIVNFWATWCAPCRAEIPDLIRLQTKYRDHLRIVGFSADEGDLTPVKNFVAALRMNFPNVMMTPELDGLFGGVHALPMTLLVDRQGRIVKRHMGAIDARTVEREVRELAGLPPG